MPNEINQEKDQLKKVIHNLEAFANRLIDLIVDGSEEGKERLINIIHTARLAYTLEEYWGWSTLVSFTRHRGGLLERAANEFKAFPDPTARLSGLQLLISEGSWESTSANTQIFIALINDFEGYEKETDSYLCDKIIPDLKVLLLKAIPENISYYEEQKRIRAMEEKIAQEEARIAQEQRQQRDEELNRIRMGKNQVLERSMIFLDLSQAASFAQANPDRRSFCLVHEGGKWNLSWYDFFGQANRLILSDELLSRLTDFDKINARASARSSQASLSPEQLRMLMPRCNMAVDEFLARLQLLLNPSEASLVELKSTFVLQGEKGSFQLTWFDATGNRQDIALESYPQFAAWLNEATVVTVEDYNLRTYLQHINVRREIDEVKQATVQDVLQKRMGITLLASNDWTKIPKYKLIPGTYILTKEEEPDCNPSPVSSSFTAALPIGNWVLYQRQKGGVNQLIDTSTWTDYLAILKGYETVSAEALCNTVLAKIKMAINSVLFVEPVRATEEDEHSVGAVDAEESDLPSPLAVGSNPSFFAYVAPPVRKLDKAQFSEVIDFFTKKNNSGDESSSTNPAACSSTSLESSSEESDLPSPLAVGSNPSFFAYVAPPVKKLDQAQYSGVMNLFAKKNNSDDKSPSTNPVKSGSVACSSTSLDSISEEKPARVKRQKSGGGKIVGLFASLIDEYSHISRPKPNEGLDSECSLMMDDSPLPPDSPLM